VLGLSTSTQRLKEVSIETHRHNRARTIAEWLPTSFAEQFNGVAGLGLVGPRLDLLVADRLAIDRPRAHTQIVIRKCGEVGTPSVAGVFARTEAPDASVIWCPENSSGVRLPS
jgi:hypothetical protein